MNITILVAVISVVAAVSGIILGWTARARETKKSISEEAGTGAVLRSDVEYIKRGIDDIRVDQRAMRQDMGELTERVTRVEESAKQAHKRIDGLERR